MSVALQPMPRSYLKISGVSRPGHPPVFDGDPAPGDIELARALFLELDADSQRWYCRCPVFADLAPVLPLSGGK